MPLMVKSRRRASSSAEEKWTATRPSSVEISTVRTKCRDLELKCIFEHDDDTKVRADRVSSGENLLHLFRARVESRHRYPSAFRRAPDRARSRPRSRPRARPRAIARPAGKRLSPSAIVLFSSSASRSNCSGGRRRSHFNEHRCEFETITQLAADFCPDRARTALLARRRIDTALFICSALAIIPLAGRIGRATEALAARVGAAIGGLLNVTFGNAAELIIAVIALSKGLTSVVKASITGSIIGNVLLVLGLSALLGGAKYREQHFNRTAARTSAISLSLAAIALVIPTVFHAAPRAEPDRLEPSDRATTLVRHRHRSFLHLRLRPDVYAENAQATFRQRRIKSEAKATLVAVESDHRSPGLDRVRGVAFGVSGRLDRKRADFARD